MPLPPDSALSLFIPALTQQYDILKQQFDGRNFGQSETLSVEMAGYSEMIADSKTGESEVLVAIHKWQFTPCSGFSWIIVKTWIKEVLSL